MRVLLWFHRDLRTHDHPGLRWVKANGHQAIAVAVAPSPRACAAKLTHWHNLTQNLAANLRAQGIELLIGEGPAADFVAQTANRLGVEKVITHRRMNSKELAELAALKRMIDCELMIQGDLTLYSSTHAHDLSLNDLRPFTKFKKFAEANWKIPEEIDSSTKESSAALERLHDYVWESRAVTHYHETRNGLLNTDDSSKFSPWLAWGALSPRRVYHELKKLEREIGPNAGIDGLIYELIWRDYFKFLAHLQGDSFFDRDGLRPTPFIFHEDYSMFASWRCGETGDDFVDANMRELLATGWMSNRGRQNVASYFSKTLKLDWRLGAAWFEEQLIDEDPENNYGNWQYIAGVGTDPRDRLFNVQHQANLYDAKGEYRDRWLRTER